MRPKVVLEKTKCNVKIWNFKNEYCTLQQNVHDAGISSVCHVVMRRQTE